MIIGVNMGHTLTGIGTGAVGFVKETDKNRQAGKRLIEMLVEKGHTVIDCTINQSSNDLAEATRKANAQRIDLFISLHLNAYKQTEAEMGVETYIFAGNYTGKQELKSRALKIQANLVNQVGWKNRGVKEADFYVLRETNCPAILVELGFCDSRTDMAKWNTEKIAKALFQGITDVVYISSTPPTENGKQLFYRVITGSYTDRANAEAQQRKLKSEGFDSFLEAFYK